MNDNNYARCAPGVNSPHAPGAWAWVGVGANLGDAAAACRQATATLAALPGVARTIHSRLYRSEPVGGGEQPWYVNGVVGLATAMEPEQLLAHLMAIEARHGRDRPRERRWGPRPLDLDLLLHGTRIRTGTPLVLPHPRLHLRRFVLQPLAEVASGVVHPLLRKTVDTLLGGVDDPHRVTPL